MAESEQLLWFAVVDLADGSVCYVGESDGEAVKAWVPGTVHGQGLSKALAIKDALYNAVRVRWGLEAAARRLKDARR